MISEVNDVVGSFPQFSDFIVAIQDQTSKSNNNKIHML
jgi:hypothetical protein